MLLFQHKQQLKVGMTNRLCDNSCDNNQQKILIFGTLLSNHFCQINALTRFTVLSGKMRKWKSDNKIKDFSFTEKSTSLR